MMRRMRRRGGQPLWKTASSRSARRGDSRFPRVRGFGLQSAWEGFIRSNHMTLVADAGASRAFGFPLNLWTRLTRARLALIAEPQGWHDATQ